MAFGKQLKEYRERTRLTQRKLAEGIEQETGVIYTPQAVSEWEREKSQIHKDDRDTLVSIIATLYKHQGITTLDEANGLLEQGNYRPLGKDEIQLINSTWHVPINESVFISIPENHTAFDGHAKTPSDTVVDWINRLTTEWTPEKALRLCGWFLLVWLAYILLLPTLQWPVLNVNNNLLRYVGGMTLLPIGVGLLTLSESRKIWQVRAQQISTWQKGLLFYAGSVTGFQLGFAIAFGFALLIQWGGVDDTFVGTVLWMISAVTIILMGYVGADQIPRSLWTVQKIEAANGTFKFPVQDVSVMTSAFAILLPVGIYFLSRLEAFWLNTTLGLPTLIIAFGLLAAILYVQKQHSGNTILPISFWVGWFGLMIILFELQRSNWQWAGLMGVTTIGAVLLTRRFCRD